jgi:CCR4-NOT transcription complex subunit 1
VQVFKHTNPMIAGILSLMAEIHAMPRLKLNISFVIEMTFKTFEVSLNDVCPSTALRDLPRVQLHNPDFSALPEAPKAPSGAALHAPLVMPGAPPALTPPPSLVAAAGAAGAAEAGAAGAAAAGSAAAAAPPGTPPQAGAAAAAATPEAGKGPAPSPAAQQGMAGAAGAGQAPAAAASAEPGLLTKLHMYVQISPQLGPLAERLQLKRLVPVAVDRAMCDIITPVVERSVTIACMTTYELVTKDYATDPDESRLRQAAHLMVSSLAGSLALVTCKEPLRVSLSNQLRSMLQQLEPNTLEQAVQVGMVGCAGESARVCIFGSVLGFAPRRVHVLAFGS